MCLYLEKLLSFANVFYDFIVINRRVFFHIILSGFFSSFLIVEPALFPGLVQFDSLYVNCWFQLLYLMRIFMFVFIRDLGL